jgi:hypothetical protein
MALVDCERSIRVAAFQSRERSMPRNVAVQCAAPMVGRQPTRDQRLDILPCPLLKHCM